MSVVHSMDGYVMALALVVVRVLLSLLALMFVMKCRLLNLLCLF